MQTLTGSQDAVDEFLPGDFPVLVLVDAPEEIHDPGFLVVHPAHVFLPPDVKIEVCKLLQLQGKPRESQWGKCTPRTTPIPAWASSWCCPSLPALLGSLVWIYPDNSHSGLPKLNSQHRHRAELTASTWVVHPRSWGCSEPRAAAGTHRRGGSATGTQRHTHPVCSAAGDVSSPQTAIPIILGTHLASPVLLGMFPHPQISIPIIVGTHLPSPLPSEQPRRDFLLILQVPPFLSPHPKRIPHQLKQLTPSCDNNFKGFLGFFWVSP